MNIKSLRSFVAKLDSPFVPVGSTVEALCQASVDVRIVHRPARRHRARLAMELKVSNRCEFVDLAPVGWAFIHHFGWRNDEPALEWEPVMGSEDLIDAILALTNAPSLGARAWCTSEWTVRARASAAVEELARV